MTISGGGAAALERPRPPPFRAFDSTRRYAAAPRHATLRYATLRDSLGRERPTRRRKTRRETLGALSFSFSRSSVVHGRPYWGLSLSAWIERDGSGPILSLSETESFLRNGLRLSPTSAAVSRLFFYLFFCFALSLCLYAINDAFLEEVWP